MKFFISYIAFLTTFATFAAENTQCQANAERAAVEAYSAKYGESTFYTKSKFKPISKGDEIIHLIQIIDSENDSNVIVSVTLDKLNCNVINID